MTQHSSQHCPNCGRPMIATDENNSVCPNDVSILREIMDELDPDGTERYQTMVLATAEAADNLSRAQRLVNQMDSGAKPRSKRNRRKALQLLHRAQDAARLARTIILLRPDCGDIPCGAPGAPKGLEAIISESCRNRPGPSIPHRPGPPRYPPLTRNSCRARNPAWSKPGATQPGARQPAGLFPLPHTPRRFTTTPAIPANPTLIIGPNPPDCRGVLKRAPRRRPRTSRTSHPPDASGQSNSRNPHGRSYFIIAQPISAFSTSPFQRAQTGSSRLRDEPLQTGWTGGTRCPTTVGDRAAARL